MRKSMNGLSYIVLILLIIVLLSLFLYQLSLRRKLQVSNAELTEQAKQYQEILTSNAKLIKGKTLLRLCYGADFHSTELQDSIAFFHLNQHLQSTAVVLIQFSDSAPLFNNFHKDTYYLEQQNLIKICCDTAVPFYSSFWQWENPKTMLGIIEIVKESSENTIILNIQKLGAALQEACSLEGIKSPVIAVGNVSYSPKTLSRSYNEAVELLNHKIHHHLITPYYYEEFKRTELQFDYNKQLLLARYIRLGKSSDATELLNSYFSVIHANPDTSISMVRNTSRQIIEVIQTAIREMPTVYTNCSSLFPKAEQEFDTFATVHDFGRLLIETTQNICEVVLSVNASKGKLKIQNLIHWLNENYSQDISLETMAAYIECSPAYTSKLFKKETGEDIIKYLSTIRIHHAKELLNTTKMTLTEISASVGFNHQQTFIRNFKNITGLTPTEYRNSNNSKSNDNY